MKNLDAILPELANYIADYNQSNQAISEVAVGWHLEHSLLVIKQITATVAQSEPKLYKSKFNTARFFVFLSKTIPRESLKNTYQAVTYLKDCEANQYFMHPFFGQLNKKQTIKFLEIHTEHHLKIIRDILK
jgi:hypothetical protein